MIFTVCKNCKKTIALPYDSVDTLKEEATHVKCFHCDTIWPVDELFMQKNEIKEDDRFFTRLNNEIHELTPEAICANIHNLSERCNIDPQVIMEYWNLIIGKKNHAAKQNTDLLHFVRIEPGVVNLHALEQRLNKALADSKHQAQSYITIVTGDPKLRKKFEDLQKEKEELLKQNRLLSAELNQLKEEIKKYR